MMTVMIMMILLGQLWLSCSLFVFMTDSLTPEQCIQVFFDEKF